MKWNQYHVWNLLETPVFASSFLCLWQCKTILHTKLPKVLIWVTFSIPYLERKELGWKNSCRGESCRKQQVCFVFTQNSGKNSEGFQRRCFPKRKGRKESREKALIHLRNLIYIFFCSPVPDYIGCIDRWCLLWLLSVNITILQEAFALCSVEKLLTA